MLGLEIQVQGVAALSSLLPESPSLVAVDMLILLAVG